MANGYKYKNQQLFVTLFFFPLIVSCVVQSRDWSWSYSSDFRFRLKCCNVILCYDGLWRSTVMGTDRVVCISINYIWLLAALSPAPGPCDISPQNSISVLLPSPVTPHWPQQWPLIITVPVIILLWPRFLLIIINTITIIHGEGVSSVLPPETRQHLMMRTSDTGNGCPKHWLPSNMDF